MKILYVTNTTLPDHQAGAVRVLGNCLAFKKLGNEVIVLDASKELEHPGCSILENCRFVQGIKVYSRGISSSKIKDYLRCEFVIKEILEVLNYEKPDVVIFYNYYSFALRRMVGICKKRGISVISDCTEWYSSRNYHFPFSFFCALDTFYRMRIVNKKVDKIITVSSFLDSYYKKQDTYRIPFLVDVDAMNAKKETISSFDSNKLNITYSGSPSKVKERLKEIVMAISSSSNCGSIILRIVGVSKEQFFKMYPDMKKESFLEKVIFYGRVSRDNSLEIIKKSDFLIFYRKKTRQNMAGFPTKFVEAVSLGVPVITTDTSDLRDFSLNNNLQTFFITDQNSLSLFLSRPLDELKAYKKNNAYCIDLFNYKNAQASIQRWLNKKSSIV